MTDQRVICPATGETLLTVQELAELLKVPPSWVYGHADELRAFRLGKYLRFSLHRVLERLEDGAVRHADVGSPTQRPPASATKQNSSDGRRTN